MRPQISQFTIVAEVDRNLNRCLKFAKITATFLDQLFNISLQYYVSWFEIMCIESVLLYAEQ